MSTTGLRRVLQLARKPVTWIATDAPARVFVLAGEDAPDDPEMLRLTRDVILLESPRSATILLISGRLPDVLREAAQRIHDQLAHPRRTVWWATSATLSMHEDGHEDAHEAAHAAGIVTDPLIVRGTARASLLQIQCAQDDELRPEGRTSGDAAGHDVAVDALDTLVAVLKRTQRELVTGMADSEADILPDVDPAPWRGVGPYGQGGAGMTGGVPYGRPLAERAQDRDTLELDQVPLRVGPFFHAFPSGFVLDVQLQGDVVQAAVVSAEPAASLSSVFVAALDQPVPIAVIECERAQSHLRWLAHALRVHGLGALGKRALLLAGRLAGDHASMSECATELQRIARSIDRSGIFWWSTRGVGLLGSDDAIALGPIARAAGMADDARIDEPAYHSLGFKPIMQSSGDSSARTRQRIAEAAQSLDLAQRANGACAWGSGLVEGPRGLVTRSERPEARLYPLLPRILAGLEWGDAVTTIVSVDLGPGGNAGSVLPWIAKEQAMQAAAKSGAMDMGQMSHGM